MIRSCRVDILGSIFVTPRSGGYGDVTAMYIRRSEIPSRIYPKYQYMQELECGSTVVIYIPTEKYKYMIITESDTILQDITSPKIQKYIIQRDIQKLRGAHEQQEGSREPNRRGTGRKSCGDNPNFCYAPTVTEEFAAYSDHVQ